MKLVITADGDSMSSKFCPNFSQCQYLIIYDTQDKTYASRLSPSFENKSKEVLVDFLKKIFMQDIITGEFIDDDYFYVYIPDNINASVNDVIIEYLNLIS